jgi:hypothetical protein
LLAVVVAVFGHNPLLDYRLPETNVHWWCVDVDPDTFMVAGSGRAFWLSGSVEPRYGMLTIDERKYVYLNSGLWTGGAVSKGYSLYCQPRVYAIMDWYPTRLPVSIGGQSYSSGEVRREQERGYWTQAEPPVWVPGLNSSLLSASTETELGPAVGRLRDATPVLQALLVEEALAKENVLAAPMGEDAVQALARALAAGSQVFYSHDGDKGTKFYYAQVESVLAATGCITGRLPARVWLRIREIVGHQPLLDDRSWLYGAKLSVRCGVSGRMERYAYDRWGQQGEGTTAYADVSGLAMFEFGYPFTTRLHLSGSARALYQPDIGRQDDAVSVVLSYLLPDRMLVDISSQCRATSDDLSWGEGTAVQTYRGISLAAHLTSYVEDRSTLSLGVSCYGHAWQSGTPSPWQRGWGLGCNVSLRRYF